MDLIHKECPEDHIYKLEFLEKIENHLLTIRMEFKEHWRLVSRHKDLLNDFGQTVGLIIRGTEEEFPYDSKKNLVSIPLHIPHPYGRQLFKECMDFYIKESRAPMHTSYSDHPGYPELVVTFDIKILTSDVVRRLIASIMQAINHCETEKQLIETEDQTTEDELLDEVDENVVVEFDFDEDLKSVMKEPVSRVVQSIGGGMGDA